VDRLVRLARRGGIDRWTELLPQAIVLAGIGLLGNSADMRMEGLYLMALLAILMVGQRQGRFGGARKWAIFTPGTAVLLLFVTTGGGYFHFGLTVAIVCAIISVGAAVLGPATKEN
jgi:hypothetical protein